jgi:hypothetical protein
VKRAAKMSSKDCVSTELNEILGNLAVMLKGNNLKCVCKLSTLKSMRKRGIIKPDAQIIPMYILSLKTTEKFTSTLQITRSKHVAGSYQLNPLPTFVERDQ